MSRKEVSSFLKKLIEAAPATERKECVELPQPQQRHEDQHCHVKDSANNVKNGSSYFAFAINASREPLKVSNIYKKLSRRGQRMNKKDLRSQELMVNSVYNSVRRVLLELEEI